MKEIYKPIVKKFLGKDVRVIQVDTKEYMVLKDMFKVLGRVKSDGTWTNEKNKMLKFLNGIGKLSDHQTLVVCSKGKKQSKETQSLDCLLLETIPVILTQFEPTARKGKEALDEWYEFMKWVNELLMEAKAHEIIIKDKVEQNRISEIITTETDHKMVAVNSMICKMMAELIGVYPDVKKLTKEELKIYQPRLTIDLIEVRQEVLKVYQQQLIINDSKSDAYDNTLKYMKRMYKLE